MKTKLLGTALILAMCSSCEMTDETFATETSDNYRDNQATKACTTNSVKSSDYQTYKGIVTSFVYDHAQSYVHNIHRFEKHVNLLVPDETARYQSIDEEQLAVLLSANEHFISELNYSAEFKTALYDIVYLNKQFVPQLSVQSESDLIRNLFEMYNDNVDDKLNKKRTIAFAYGAQYNFTLAILYAGAVELSR